MVFALDEYVYVCMYVCMYPCTCVFGVCVSVHVGGGPCVPSLPPPSLPPSVCAPLAHPSLLCMSDCLQTVMRCTRVDVESCGRVFIDCAHSLRVFKRVVITGR